MWEKKRNSYVTFIAKYIKAMELLIYLDLDLKVIYISEVIAFSFLHATFPTSSLYYFYGWNTERLRT